MAVVETGASLADTSSELFDERTLVALEYADAMTVSDASDELFARVQRHFNTEEIVELTATIAWENASARFNRAIRVDSQGLWTVGNPIEGN